jgi:choline/glycine/proline betaine transport protein
MLVAGGVTTMEYATLIFALPVTVIAYLVMASFSKVLRMERAEREGRARRRRGLAVHGGPAPEKTWRQRLARMRSFPSAKSAGRFLTEVAQPALETVASEFRTPGGPVALTHETNEETGLTDSVLQVDMGEHRSFLYQVTAVAYRVPTYGARSAARGDDVYFRIEVFTHTGSEGYDLLGLNRQQIIDDVLDRYETHLSFLDYSSEHAYDSVLTPPPAQPMTGPVRTVEESGEDVEAVRPSLRAARRPVEDAKPSSGSGSSPVQGTDEGRDIG